jgi:hypothetical protein
MAHIEDPMAWIAFATDGSESCAVYSTDGEAQSAADAWGWKILPLYLAPRLTDAEREAIERAADLVDAKTCGDPATLRGLLERMT